MVAGATVVDDEEEVQGTHSELECVVEEVVDDEVLLQKICKLMS